MSLRNLLRQRITDHVIEAAKKKMKKKYSLIIGDDVTIRILHHCFKMHELNDMNIGVVVNVSYPRERVRLSPIYFLSGNIESIKKMVDDYKDIKNPKYGSPVHAFFVSPLEPRSIELLKNSNLIKNSYLSTCEEIRCDFLVLEQKVFSLDRDQAFSTLYLKDSERRSDELDRTAQQLVGVFLTMNEEPYVRYSGASRLARDLAQLVVKRLNEVKSNLSNWEPVEDRATLVILDRADDPLTPLMHSMTFQSMVCDLLADQIKGENIGGGRKPVALDEKKDEDSEFILPNEDDKIWSKYRHTFIGEVNKKLPKDFADWRDASAVVKFRDKKNGENMSNSELMKAAQDMPQYQQQIRRFKVNLDLAQAVTKQFANQHLLDVILLEQDIACWIDSDGKKCDRDKLGARCSQDIFMSKDPKPNELKLRLFMIYLIAQGGLSDLVRKNLMEQAGFTEKDQNTIMNLAALQVVLSSAKPPKEGHRNSEYWNAVQKAAKGKTESNSDETSPIRFLSFLEWALTNHIEGAEGKFEEHIPYGAEKPVSGKARKRQPTSYRRQRKAENEKPPSGPRVIVFILGGVTYSELCTCYELSEKHNVDIFVGSTTIMSPQKYIQLLSQHRDF